MSEFVSLDDSAGLATVVLSRPPTNALTRQVYRELAATAAELERRDDVFAVILFGGHGIFSAGDDRHELNTLTPAEAEITATVRDKAIAAVAAISKPTVAAITGYALGGGLTLALAADWRISGDNVKFGATEILAGLIPGGGGMSRLACTIGLSRAKELVFSGRFVEAKEALALGLIDEMVAPDGVHDAAVAWARRFTDGPRQALAAAKASLNEIDKLSPAERLVVERHRYVQAFTAVHGCPQRR